MNKDSIFGYVKLYKNILKKNLIFLDEKDLNNIYQLILLVFELDDLYDVVSQYPASERKLANLKKAMISLMPNHHPIGLKAIALLFKAMKDESLFKANQPQNLEQYLRVCSQSIGASIITAYLVSKIKLEPSIWHSNILVSFNNEINILIRLANDYLDIDTNINRGLKEIPQIKAIHFFDNKSRFKKYFLGRYVFHKLLYYVYQIRFKYLKLSSNWKDYSQAIACSESVLDWAVKVYIIDRNSCQ